MRDRTVGETFYFLFTTRSFSTGAPATLSGTPVISAYEDNSAVQITAGVSLSADHDSVTGLNLVTVAATGGNGFEAGKDYHLVITTGTVGGVSVVGEVVGHFSLGLDAAFTRLGAPAGASVSADIATVDTVVDGIQTDLDNGTDGLGAIKGDTAAILVDTADMQPKLGTVSDLGGGATIGANLSDQAGATFNTATDSQEAIRNHIGDGTNLTEAGGDGDHLTAVPWNASWDAEVESDVNDALVALHLDHLLAADYDPATPPGIATALLNELVESDGGVARFTQNALEQAPDTTTGLSVDTVNDKTGYAIGVGGIAATAFAAGAIDAAAIAADAIGASELAQGAAQEIADEVLNRDLAGGGSGDSRNVRNALRALRNRVAIAGGTVTVYQEDDTASAWTGSVSTAAGNPISEVDPV